MTVNIDNVINVPSDTAPYDLIADWTTMRNDIYESIHQIEVELLARPETGSDANFHTITCEATGTFHGSVIIKSPELPTATPLQVKSNTTVFGLEKTGIGSLLFSGGKWWSSARLAVEDAIEPTDATNLRVMNAAIAIEASARAAQDTYLLGKMVYRSASGETWAPNADWATNANHANTADHASTATSLSGGPTGPQIFAGINPPGKPEGQGHTVSGKGVKDFTLDLVPYGVPDRFPHYLGLTVVDINGDEVVSMVRTGWTDRRRPPIRLKNLSAGAENVRVEWLAVYL